MKCCLVEACTQRFLDYNDRFVKWQGRTIYRIHEKLAYPVALITSAVAYLLFPLAARCVVFTSSRSFKRTCQPERVMQSHQVLQTLGGEEVCLRMPDGHQVSAMYFDSKKCLDALCKNGAEKGIISLPEGDVQDVLWISPQNEQLNMLIQKMGLPLLEESSRQYLPVGLPRKPSESHYLALSEDETSIKDHESEHQPGTVIYAQGSGHLFEFRRKTIGTFTIRYGMNMLVLNYSGTGQSEGKISEQATYDNMEAAYQYLSGRGVPDHKMFGYGHCMGGGPILNLASKHPTINVLIDRSYLQMGEFAKLLAKTFLHLPSFLDFLINWIQPVMSKCFRYDNRENIQLVRGRVAILGAEHDEIIPKEYIQELYDKAVLAKDKIQLFMNSTHDPDLIQDESIYLALGKFLTKGDDMNLSH